MWLIYSVECYPYEGCNPPEILGRADELDIAKAWVEFNANNTFKYKWSDYIKSPAGNVLAYCYSADASDVYWYVEVVTPLVVHKGSD